MLWRSFIPPVVLWTASSVATTAAGSNCLRPGVGLKNLGNTCYLNAQLQCAYHIPRVRQLIVGQSDNDEDPSVALTALQQLFADLQSSSSRPVAPRLFCTTLNVPVQQQQDTQEFWKLLLPALKLPALTDLYQGAYQDYIVAMDGSGRERRREEAFLDLSLEVTPAGSVVASLQQLFGPPEVLRQDQGNGWRPAKGADPVDAQKGTLLRSPGLSSILQLHLKRFQFDWMTEKTNKINDQFSFPVVLDLSTICQDTANDAKSSVDDDRVLYDLQAVIVHAGEYGSGHYYAYIRPDIHSDTWYRFNDDVVEEVKLKDVLCDAYGGRYQINDNNHGDENGGGILARLKRTFLSKGPSYGYGGSTSNAYVLQYIRRSDIPRLYREDDE